LTIAVLPLHRIGTPKPGAGEPCSGESHLSNNYAPLIRWYGGWEPFAWSAHLRSGIAPDTRMAWQRFHHPDGQGTQR